LIEIKDTGEGIDKKYLERIFEPFFSLKESHSGLGLYFVKKLLDFYKGDIRIKSEKGIGTCVSVFIPFKK
jgi:signal transduction histidine kinase